MKRVLVQRLGDLWTGCKSLPSAAAWRRCLLLYLIFAGCAVPLGFASGLFRVEPLHVGPAALLVIAALLFVRPALIEELVFRGLLLPRNPNGLTRCRLWAVCGISLCLFVASHVMNGLLFHHAAREVFTNPWFLLEAAMLGAMCMATYLTSGSIWPCVAAHWLTVTTWIVLLGGQSLVGGGARLSPGQDAMYSRAQHTRYSPVQRDPLASRTRVTTTSS